MIFPSIFRNRTSKSGRLPMKKQIKNFMLVLLALWGIPSLAGEMEPRDAAELCLSPPRGSTDKAGLLGADKSALLNSVNTLYYILWDRKGHFYTTSRVASYAGISDPARWLTLSYY